MTLIFRRLGRASGYLCWVQTVDVSATIDPASSSVLSGRSGWAKGRVMSVRCMKIGFAERCSAPKYPDTGKEEIHMNCTWDDGDACMYVADCYLDRVLERVLACMSPEIH